MNIEDIQHNFWKGNFTKVLEVEGDDFYLLSYQALTMILSGNLDNADSLVESLDLGSPSPPKSLVNICLKTCILAFRGYEQEVNNLFSQGEKLLQEMDDDDRQLVAEWEGWLYYGMGIFNFFNQIWERPIEDYFIHSLDIFKQLPHGGGSEWAIIPLYLTYAEMTKEITKLEKIIKQLDQTTADKGIISQTLCQWILSMYGYWQGERGNYDKYFDMAKIFEKQKVPLLEGWVLHGAAIMIHIDGDFDKAIQIFKMVHEKFSLSGIFFRPLVGMLASTYINLGNLEEAIRWLIANLELTQKIGNLSSRYGFMLNIADQQFNLGNHEKASKFIKQSIEGYREMGNMRGEASALHLMGNQLKQRMEMDRAIDHYNLALNLSEKVDHLPSYGGKYSFSSNIRAKIAELYSFKGEFEKALELIEISLKKSGDGRGYITNLYDLQQSKGTILFRLGDFPGAEETFKECLSDLEEVRGEKFTGYSLYMLTLITNKLGKEKEAVDYLSRLKNMDQQLNVKWLHQNTQMAEAVLLKSSPRASNKVKAQELFTKVIYETQYIENKRFSMLNLLDILLWELSSSGHNDILVEIQNLLNDLGEMASKEGSITLKIDLAMIQSQIYLIEGDAKKALELLGKSLGAAIKHNLSNYRMRVEKQQKQVNDEIGKWMDLNQQNASLVKRLEQSKISDYVNLALTMIEKGVEKSVE